jgi:D-sedoheptulose 7-phosphate isomerase|tara:strand:+ start:14062 stop:14634 length:573 start_codon:yes stop_codon:yes gene_type:complete
MYSSEIHQYLQQVREITESLNVFDINNLATQIKDLRSREGRLFVCGVGGSAGNASHAVNDFRKILGIESYAPTDNVSELTARINDEGWDTSISNWLKISNFCKNDAILVLSVGGGSENTSQNLVKAMELARQENAKVLSIVSRDGGVAKKLSDVCVLVPVIDVNKTTPHAEEFQAIIWHMLVTVIGRKDV